MVRINESAIKSRFLKWLPVTALVAGFIWAFITAGVHSMLFALLPLLAFAFGYFSTWPEAAYASSPVSVYGIVCGVVGMAGVVCLVYAFWIKFKARTI